MVIPSCLNLRIILAGTANTGGGEHTSPPYPAPIAGNAGGSGIVIVIECVQGAKAKSGIYSMQAQFRDIKRSAW